MAVMNELPTGCNGGHARRFVRRIRSLRLSSVYSAARDRFRCEEAAVSPALLAQRHRLVASGLAFQLGFFPTPKSVIYQMLDEAGIEDGDFILELWRPTSIASPSLLYDLRTNYSEFSTKG